MKQPMFVTSTEPAYFGETVREAATKFFEANLEGPKTIRVRLVECEKHESLMFALHYFGDSPLIVVSHDKVSSAPMVRADDALAAAKLMHIKASKIEALRNALEGLLTAYEETAGNDTADGVVAVGLSHICGMTKRLERYK